MIKTERGNTQLMGNLGDLLTDFTIITQSMFECMTDDQKFEADEAKKMLTRSFERGFKNTSEIINEMDDKVPEVVKAILNALADHFTNEDEKEGEK